MVSATQKDDAAGWGGDTGRGETWAQFDALPVGVKRLYWNAPFNYTALPAYVAMRQGVELRANVARQWAAMQRDLLREVLRVYGPSHPQARA